MVLKIFKKKLKWGYSDLSINILKLHTLAWANKHLDSVFCRLCYIYLWFPGIMISLHFACIRPQSRPHLLFLAVSGYSYAASGEIIATNRTKLAKIVSRDHSPACGNIVCEGTWKICQLKTVRVVKPHLTLSLFLLGEDWYVTSNFGIWHYISIVKENINRSWEQNFENLDHN